MKRFVNIRKILGIRKLTIIKYSFSFTITSLSLLTTGNFYYLLFSLLELIIIFSLTNMILKRSTIAGNIFDFIFLLIYNVELLVLMFGNSFVTLIMINNLSSWEALKGRMAVYLLGFGLLFLFSFLPVIYIEPNNIKFNRAKNPNIRYFNLKLVIGALLMEMILLFSVGYNYSPAYSTYDLSENYYKYNKLIQSNSSKSIKSEKFHKDEVKGYVEKPNNLPESPNVILIFVEGMSQHIIDDERNIAPNIREVQSKSLNFKNYYNHTFATYAGIIGQLYSGYQLQNHDKNYLISLPQVLSAYGYHTSFINTEPKNKEFTTYLNNLGFDKVIPGPVTKSLGVTSDKDAYKKLLSEINKENQSPFFISMYTFGTHLGMDGYDRKFGDGSDRLLSRFHDMDYQFGKFIEEFNNSSLAENTILVLTTDHATFVDDEYRKSFPKNDRVQGNLDKVPFFIYYKGIEAQTVDVEGRNSLGLTPTVLDYLDISTGNYFLGESLFSKNDKNDPYSHLFVSELTYRLTHDSSISFVPDKDKDNIEEKVSEYYSIARNK